VKFLDEYRREEDAQRLLARIDGIVTKPWTLMEICGGQTHTLMRSGIDRMLPDAVTLVHGPGCPVCVTPVSLIDHAIEIAERPGVTLASFGDMLRVPGSASDLLSAKSRGADVRMVYSPLDAVRLAQRDPSRDVVFFAVGFETTAPANAMSVRRAHDEGLDNFFLLSSHVRVPPAMEAILGDPQNRVQGFLAAGHVCTVMGTAEYGPIAERYGIPITVTGFEPLDLLHGIYLTLRALEEGRAGVENQYGRVVRPEGNVAARALLDDVFAVCDRDWRGFGTIPASGFDLAPKYARLDAAVRFPRRGPPACESPECIAGEILRGLKKPHECPAFSTRCTPEKPLGAPMVSSEGACAAYYAYARHEL